MGSSAGSSSPGSSSSAPCSASSTRGAALILGRSDKRAQAREPHDRVLQLETLLLLREAYGKDLRQPAADPGRVVRVLLDTLVEVAELGQHFAHELAQVGVLSR